MGIKIYKIDSTEKQKTIVIREILRNKYKNIKIYTPLELESNMLSTINKYKFKNISLKHYINFTEIQIQESKNMKEYITFYLDNKYGRIATLSDDIENTDNIIILNSFEGKKITFDKYMDNDFEVVNYCNITELKEGIEDKNNENNDGLRLNEIATPQCEIYDDKERLIEEKINIGEDKNIDVIKIVHNEEQNIEVVHIKHTNLKKVFLGIIASATKRIDIMSPWINDIACDDDIIDIFKDALKRGVDINIIYGIGNTENLRSRKSEEVATTLSANFENSNYIGKFKIAAGNTHYKAILCDDYISLCGSLNYLSCNPDNIDWIEAADYIYSDKIVKIKRQEYFNFGGNNNEQ